MIKCARYRDKYFSVLGDSMSTFEGCSIPHGATFYDTKRKLEANVISVSDTWWGRVIEELGAKLLVNNSFSGSTVTRSTDCEIPSYACSTERTSLLHDGEICPDVIMVLIGTNDWGCGRQISYTDGCNVDKNSISLFSVAYEKMLENLKSNYPDAEIWCLTLPISCCSLKNDFSFPYAISGRHIYEYSDAIRICTDKHNCVLIDLHSNTEPYDTIDGFHPSYSGMKTLAQTVITAINELYF